MRGCKCITFDKKAQDLLPDHIKDKMKADREKAKQKGTPKVFLHIISLKDGELTISQYYDGIFSFSIYGKWGGVAGPAKSRDILDVYKEVRQELLDKIEDEKKKGEKEYSSLQSYEDLLEAFDNRNQLKLEL